jgi:hypothetical protein
MTYEDLADVRALLLDVPPSQEEVWDAVADPEWQGLRRAMKGMPTIAKLVTCRCYLDICSHDTVEERRKAQVQVHNYIGALKRGGQLTKDGEIQR